MKNLVSFNRLFAGRHAGRAVPRVALLAMVLVAGAPTAVLASTPSWLIQAAADKTPSESAAVVLHDEIIVTIISDVRTRTVHRYAVRVNARAGRDAAALFEPYPTFTGQVHVARGWLLRAGEPDREFGEEAVVDRATANNDVYDKERMRGNVRMRGVTAADIVREGDVFGAEIAVEDRVPFSQIEWSMRGRWPVRLSRRSLALPPGWSASSVTINAPDVAPWVDGTVWVWEMRALPEIVEEPAMPPLSAVVPRIAVTISRQGRVTAAATRPAFLRGQPAAPRPQRGG